MTCGGLQGAEFRKWMDEVNGLCLERFGMSIYDLPDMPFCDHFEDGYSAEAFMDEHLPDLKALGSLILS